MESQTNLIKPENNMETPFKRRNHTHEKSAQLIDPKIIPFLLLTSKFNESFLNQPSQLSDDIYVEQLG